MACKLSLLVVCALLVAVQGRVLEENRRSRRSPDDSQSSSDGNFFSDALEKAKEIGQSIKSSETFQAVSSRIHESKDKLSDFGENIKDSFSKTADSIKNSDAAQSLASSFSKTADSIKNSDAAQSVKSNFNKAVDNIKDKLDD